MRFSLLLRREPFPQILEDTLSSVWQKRYGQVYEVRWLRPFQPSNPPPDGQSQVWVGNPYLNVFFVPGLASVAFDPTRREFTFSRSAWLRPFQRAYVSLALSPRLASFFAAARLHVSPPLPAAASLLVIPGNNKIRILDHLQCQVVVCLKCGFPDLFIKRELMVRTRAGQLGLPVPPIRQVDEAGGRFIEDYLSATPINRLDDPAQASQACQSVTSALAHLIRDSLQPAGLADYFHLRRLQAANLVSSNHLISSALRARLLRLLATLESRQQPHLVSPVPFQTALSHGDFQPANILLNGQGAWLVDWEFSERRQPGYDLLVYALSARHPRHLARRLHAFTTGQASELQWVNSQGWPGLDLDSPLARQRRLLLFALEELCLHLELNANPLFTALDPGLPALAGELSAWLES